MLCQILLTHLQDEATNGANATETKAEGVEAEGAVAESVDATNGAETGDTESTNGAQSVDATVPGWPLFM